MDDDTDRTLWCGNLHDSVTEELLYELFLQAGPLESVKIPEKDGKKRNYSFIRFKDPVSVAYTIELMNGIRLFERPLRLQSRTGSSHTSSGSTPGQSNPLVSPRGSESGAPYRSLHGNQPQQTPPYRSPNSGDRWQHMPSPHRNENTEFKRSFSSPQFSNDNPFSPKSGSGSSTPERQFSNSPDPMQKANVNFRSFPPGGMANPNMGMGFPNMGMNMQMSPENMMQIGGLLLQGGARNVNMNNFDNRAHGGHRNDPVSMEIKRQRLLQQQDEIMSRSNRPAHQRREHHQSGHSGHRHGYRKNY